MVCIHCHSGNSGIIILARLGCEQYVTSLLSSTESSSSLSFSSLQPSSSQIYLISVPSNKDKTLILTNQCLYIMSVDVQVPQTRCVLSALGDIDKGLSLNNILLLFLSS